MLDTIAWVSLAIAFVCSILIALDEIAHPQKMWIMNLIWPITALYFSVFGLWGYFRTGRRMTKSGMTNRRGHSDIRMPQERKKSPTFAQAAISDLHCGAGCVLGDIISEFCLFALGWMLFGIRRIRRRSVARVDVGDCVPILRYRAYA